MFLDGITTDEYLIEHGWNPNKVGEYYRLVAINELLSIANEKMRAALEEFAKSDNWEQGHTYGPYGIIFTNEWLSSDDPIRLAEETLEEIEDIRPIYLERMASLEQAIIDIANELGEPQPGYPAPVANAANIARKLVMI